MRRRGRDERAESGFTIIELLVAMFVLSVGVFGTIQLFLASLRTASLGEARARATALATRETEALRAIPYDSLGFASGSTAATFESLNTVFVTTPQATPTGGPEVADGVSFTFERYIVWMASGTATNAIKRTTVIVSWTDSGGIHKVRQDAAVYPGGRGVYGSSTTSTTSTTLASGPTAPTGLVAVRNSLSPTTRVDLSWTASSPAPTTWEVQHALDSAFTSPTVDTTSEPGTSTTYAKTGLAPGTTFYFRVRGRSGTQTSGWSNTATVSTATSSGTACLAGTTNATPSAQKKKRKSNELSSDVGVEVHTTGTCTGLAIRFTPSTTTVTQALTQTSGGVWTTTVYRAAYSWDTGSKTLVVVDGSNSSLATIALLVCASNASSCP